MMQQRCMSGISGRVICLMTGTNGCGDLLAYKTGNGTTELAPMVYVINTASGGAPRCYS